MSNPNGEFVGDSEVFDEPGCEEAPDFRDDHDGDENPQDEPWDGFRSDAEADADALASVYGPSDENSDGFFE